MTSSTHFGPTDNFCGRGWRDTLRGAETVLELTRVDELDMRKLLHKFERDARTFREASRSDKAELRSAECGKMISIRILLSVCKKKSVTDEHLIGTSFGTKTCRTIKRRIFTEQWYKDAYSRY